MAEPKLSQNEIDALLASIRGNEATSATAGGDYKEFDFRRPSKFAREHIRSIEGMHEVFVRRFGGMLTQTLRSVVSLEPISSDQITCEDYVRSVPNPSVMATMTVEPLPGVIVVEMSTQMGLTLVDRLLGGVGQPVAMRRPTELESNLLRELMGYSCEALAETLEPLAEVKPEIQVIEFNPHFLQAAAPNDMVLLLSFGIALNATMRTEGIFSICYPFQTLQPAMATLESHAWIEHVRRSDDDADGGDSDRGPSRRPMEALVPELDLPVVMQLKPSPVSAVDLVCLQVGDVIRLDHRVDEPAIGVVGDVQIVAGRVGRRGKRLAVELTEWGRR